MVRERPLILRRARLMNGIRRQPECHLDRRLQTATGGVVVQQAAGRSAAPAIRQTAGFGGVVAFGNKGLAGELKVGR